MTTVLVTDAQPASIAFLQSIADVAYTKYPTVGRFGAFLDVLPLFERRVVAIGKLNAEVENGGFAQWIDNGYVEGAEDTIEALTVLNTDTARKVLAMVNEAWREAESVEAPSVFYGCTCNAEDEDDCYCGEEEAEGPCVEHLDDQFYAVKGQLMDELAAWAREQAEAVTFLAVAA